MQKVALGSGVFNSTGPVIRSADRSGIPIGRTPGSKLQTSGACVHRGIGRSAAELGDGSNALAVPRSYLGTLTCQMAPLSATLAGKRPPPNNSVAANAKNRATLRCVAALTIISDSHGGAQSASQVNVQRVLPPGLSPRSRSRHRTNLKRRGRAMMSATTMEMERATMIVRATMVQRAAVQVHQLRLGEGPDRQRTCRRI